MMRNEKKQPPAKTGHPEHFFITGATSGIGKVLAEQAWKNGHVITATVRTFQQREELSREFPDRMYLHVCDLKKSNDVEALALTLRGQNFSRVVLNAGYASLGKIHATPHTETLNMFQVNLFSNLSLLRSLAPALNRNAASVCLVSSLAARIPGRNYAAYGMTKASLSYLAGALAIEYPEINILCAEIGGIDTPFHAKAGSGFDISRFKDAEKTGKRLYRAIVAGKKGIVTLFPDWYVARWFLVHFSPLALRIQRTRHAT
ncbi:MAG: SDR family NAD(P)-dependent oxidoreductase [Alphaproteobacteria bacterium]|nr:SDR family NAD(P)-dependent oxidoreductase [Alphaproteobacteria bacterium]